MSAAPPPFSVPFELSGLSDQGAELSLAPNAEERARIAAWLNALEVPRLEAAIRLARVDDGLYSYEAEFTAEVTQACVVTLEPVRSRHSGIATRRYRVIAKAAARRRQRDMRDMGVKVAEEDEATEVISSSLLDVAAPVLEELSLMLDPYPRAPGVTFEAPKDESKGRDGPFAVLAKLKGPPPKAK
jgi:uncharacterized metal-binding protein YceD (DUF177 family)